MAPRINRTPEAGHGSSFMKLIASAAVVLTCTGLLSGCSGNASQSGKSSPSATAQILGKWTTSTSPEMASSRTAMAFLESGEFQYASPLHLFGKPVTVKISEKDVAARLNCSGSWVLNGDKLRVRITQTNQPSVHVDEPWDYKIVSISDKKLEFEKETDGQ
jgi:hypothetical protein